MEKNTELAYETLDYIREHPEEWDQNQFVCGTTACYAGRAALISLGLQNQSQYHEYRINNGFDTEAIATRALGWTKQEASHVFYRFTKDFAVLERAVKEVLNGEVH
jgi:hypothetical protein